MFGHTRSRRFRAAVRSLTLYPIPIPTVYLWLRKLVLDIPAVPNAGLYLIKRPNCNAGFEKLLEFELGDLAEVGMLLKS